MHRKVGPTGVRWTERRRESDASLYLDLLDPETEDLYRRTPSRLEQQVGALPDSVEWILIDEVQRAPRLLDAAHRLIESTGKRFVLTGLSARKLRRGASNLLAGRAFVYSLYPLTVPELRDAFDLNDALRWGTLPRVFWLETDEDRRAYLRAYALTYLREEIAAEQIVRRFDPLALCISHDPTRMQIDCVLCVHWREVLEELSLGRGSRYLCR